MSIRDQLHADLKEAMRAKNTVRLEAVRGGRAAVLNGREIGAA